MTAIVPARAGTAPAATEHELAAAVISTLLREDYAGLSRWVRPASSADRSQPAGPACGHPVLRLPAGQACLDVPLEPDGFLADLRVRRPAPPITLAHVDSVLREISDPRDRDGAAAFSTECAQALAALHLRERHLPAVRAALAAAGAAGAGAWLGPAGQVRYDALAAALPHPAYPTAPCRLGLGDADALRYAPEYLPEFELNWVAVPRSALVEAGPARPPWWPSPSRVGLPDSLAATHDLMPVHPLTARAELARALSEAGLAEVGLAGAALSRALSGAGRYRAGGAVPAPGAWLRVTPTLSTRTVAVAAEPRVHLKLPLPTSTLGLRNRRSIAPGTLADGALIRRILAAAGGGEAGRLLLADEDSYAHAGHPYLGYLLRRLPAGLDQCHIVPLAALLAPIPAASPGGGPAPGPSHLPTASHAERPLVIGELARLGFGGDLPALVDAYFRLLFGTQVDLFVRYGIALEAHQQNAALVLSPAPAGTGPPGTNPAGSAPSRLRLLVKDFDGALIHYARLARALGPAAPDQAAFADDRLITGSDDALADVFITITVHLGAGALAFGLAERGLAPLPGLLAQARRALTEALDRHAGAAPAALLRARVLHADRLPGKSMVTAGTLVARERTGARDINKFYGTTGPNYLKAGAP
jgi:siderophore synthetase component